MNLLTEQGMRERITGAPPTMGRNFALTVIAADFVRELAAQDKLALIVEQRGPFWAAWVEAARVLVQEMEEK